MPSGGVLARPIDVDDEGASGTQRVSESCRKQLTSGNRMARPRERGEPPADSPRPPQHAARSSTRAPPETMNRAPPARLRAIFYEHSLRLKPLMASFRRGLAGPPRPPQGASRRASHGPATAPYRCRKTPREGRARPQPGGAIATGRPLPTGDLGASPAPAGASRPGYPAGPP